jgi:hypothetical protein
MRCRVQSRPRAAHQQFWPIQPCHRRRCIANLRSSHRVRGRWWPACRGLHTNSGDAPDAVRPSASTRVRRQHLAATQLLMYGIRFRQPRRFPPPITPVAHTSFASHSLSLLAPEITRVPDRLIWRGRSRPHRSSDTWCASVIGGGTREAAAPVADLQRATQRGRDRARLCPTSSMRRGMAQRGAFFHVGTGRFGGGRDAGRFSATNGCRADNSSADLRAGRIAATSRSIGCAPCGAREGCRFRVAADARAGW